MTTTTPPTNEIQAKSEQFFVQAALRSLEHYKRTGLHVTQLEFGEWVKAIQKDSKAPMPTCHT